MIVEKISLISQKRIENIISWVKAFENYDELSVNLEDLLTSLHFGVKADRFEAAFYQLGKALGFLSQRPEKEWKEGPDNLWALQDDKYLIVECKSEVDLIRNEIHKYEADQMNTSCAWFQRNYLGANAFKVMIIPTRNLANSAAFNDPTIQIMNKDGLALLVRNIRKFFLEFKIQDFMSLSDRYVQDLVSTYELSVESLVTKYTQPFRPYRK
jgi:hypothetical protein